MANYHGWNDVQKDRGIQEIRTLCEGIAATCCILREDYLKNSWPHIKQAFAQQNLTQIALHQLKKCEQLPGIVGLKASLNFGLKALQMPRLPLVPLQQFQDTSYILCSQLHGLSNFDTSCTSGAAQNPELTFETLKKDEALLQPNRLGAVKTSFARKLKDFEDGIYLRKGSCVNKCLIPLKIYILVQVPLDSARKRLIGCLSCGQHLRLSY